MQFAKFERKIYRFSPLLPCFVVKPSGKERLICIPTVKDRLVQRVILRQLENDPKFFKGTSVSYGFTKGKSLKDGILEAQKIRNGGKQYVLKVDIEQFFDSIPRNKVLQSISTIRSSTVRSLISTAVKTEVESRNNGVAQRISETGVKTGVGLRQGMPLSPMLSNLLLKSFDGALQKHSFSAVRYADDVAVFGKSRTECEDAYSLMTTELAGLGLSLPALGTEKCTIVGPRESIEFLGLENKMKDGTYVLTCPNKKIERLADRFQEIACLSNCERRQWNIGEVVRALNSTESGFSNALKIAADHSDFMARIAHAKQRALENFMKEIFGKEVVRKLKPNQKMILGLVPYN